MPLCKLSKDEKVELQKLVDAYDNARSSLVDFLTEVQGEWEEEMEEKSDKWKEGEAGTQAQHNANTPTMAAQIHRIDKKVNTSCARVSQQRQTVSWRVLGDFDS